MASKIKVDEIAGSTGSTVTVPTGQTLAITDGLAASTIASGTLADARIPNLSTDKLTSGTLPSARIADLAATKLTGSIADARVPASAVTQHVTATDLTPVRHDILALGLHSAVADNKVAFNLPNSAIDQFENASGVSTATDASRDTTDEHYSTVGGGTQVNFTADGTWTRGSTTVLQHILLVAGGGGGGYDAGGAGGGGGLVHTQNYAVSGTSYAVDIGTGGGYSGDSNPGATGADTTFIGATTLTAKGGGGGGSGSGGSGTDGGSGGGSGGAHTAGFGNHTQSAQSGVSGSNGFGFDGVAGASGSPGKGGGGGGGAGGAPASEWTTVQSSNGGAGKDMSAIFGTGVGDNGWFAGGGGGGSETAGATSYGNGGSGLYGGGARGGGPATGAPNSTAAVVNSGGGGGGGKNLASVGAAGFLSLIPKVSTATGTLISTANVPSAAQTEVSGVMLYKDGSGTNSIGTDLKAYFTCNGGTNWTEAAGYTTVTPVFSTGVKMVKLSKTTCTTGSDVRWKTVWANQADGSKVAQLYGMGINY